MESKKLSYLCPQADAISIDARENFCQSSSEVIIALGSENIFEDMEIVDVTF